MAAKSQKVSAKPVRTMAALHTSPPRRVGCPRCHRSVWRGYVDGCMTVVEYATLDSTQTMAATMLGIRLYLFSPTGMIWLDSHRYELIKKYAVVGEHSCARPIGNRIQPTAVVESTEPQF